MILPGFPVFRPAAASGITLIAAAGSGSIRGYDSGDYEGGAGYGSISGQPLSGAVLAWAVTGSSTPNRFTEFGFDGDVTALLSGKDLIVDGVPYSIAAAATPPAFDGTWTSFQFLEGVNAGPFFTAAASYAVLIE